MIGRDEHSKLCGVKSAKDEGLAGWNMSYSIGITASHSFCFKKKKTRNMTINGQGKEDLQRVR